MSQLTTLENYVVFEMNNVKVYQSLKVTSSPNIEGKILESIYVTPTKIIDVVLDEEPTC